MSNHLARSSQNPSQRRLKRLNFRPLVELVRREDQVTMKVPASTPGYVRPRGDFLVASKHSDGEDKLDFSLLDTRKAEQPDVSLLETRKAAKLDFSLLDTSKAAKPDKSLLGTRKALSRDVAALDPSTPLPLERENGKGAAAIDDAAEFAHRSTIPMMALTGITTKQGKPQLEMKSEVSGAAGAAGMMGLANIFGSVLKYFSAFLIQYIFGASGYGLYTLSLSLVNLVSGTFNLGLDAAMIRYVAIYRSKRQMKRLQGLLIFCTLLAGLAGLIGALILLFFTPSLLTYWISLKHHVANKETLNRTIALLQIMAPVIPLMTMQVMWFAGLRGFKAFKWRALTTGVLQPSLQLLLMVLVFFFFRNKDGITAVALVLFISTLFNTVLNLYFLFREVSRVAVSEPEQYEVREWLGFATLNFLTTIIDNVLVSIDTILLATFGVADVAIGQYGASIRLSYFIAMPLLSLNSVFAPTIAELHSKGEMQKLESMFKLMTKWSVMFSLPIFLVMALFSPYLLGLPGPSFMSAWPLLVALSLGNMVNAGTGAVGYMLLMTGYQRLSFLNSLVAVVVNVALGIYLTPRYGAMGTAISTGLAICVQNLMRMLQVRVLLKMHPYNWEVLKSIAAGLISTVLVGGVLYLLYLWHIAAALHIGHAILAIQLLLVPVFLASYIVLLIRFKGSAEDEIVLQALRKKFLSGKSKTKMERK